MSTPPDHVRLVRKRLDDDGLAAHLDELAGAQALEVRVKSAAAGHSSAASVALDVIASQLRGGELSAVQLRFFHDGAWWCDTILRAERGGYRLVRMRQDA